MLRLSSKLCAKSCSGVHLEISQKNLQQICKMSTSTAAAAPPAPEIVFTERPNVLVIELDRQKALNALTLNMCQAIYNRLKPLNDAAAEKTERKPESIAAFIVKGRGEKAFCAGGDVKSIWSDLTELGKVGYSLGSGEEGHLHTDFFRREYMMNYLLGTSLIPQVSFWNGIVMGGGVGLSVLGEFRVATEKSKFAMPETAIGLFPDVGSSAWLPHLANGYGNYIGLTGVMMNPADLLHTKLATHFVDSDKLAAVEEEIVADMKNHIAKPRDHIKSILNKYQSLSNKPDPNASAISQNKAGIELCFGEDIKNVEEIFAKLESEQAKGNAWAQTTLNKLREMSPTSLKLTFAQLQKGKDLELGECLKMEFRMVMRCMQAVDFREGVRAKLIEKDESKKKPNWNPPDLAGVTDDMIQKYFEKLGDHDLVLHK